jgi:hypothetical protein
LSAAEWTGKGKTMPSLVNGEEVRVVTWCNRNFIVLVLLFLFMFVCLFVCLFVCFSLSFMR